MFIQHQKREEPEMGTDSEFESLLDSSNRSPQALEFARECLNNIRTTDDLAISLVKQIALQRGVSEVTYKLTAPGIARVTVIYPTLRTPRKLNDDEDPVNIIKRLRDAVQAADPYYFTRLVLTIKRSEEDERGYIEGRGI